MLHYFYHFDYADEIEGGGMAPILLNMHVLSLADRYMVDSLQKLAMDKFTKRALEDWTSDAFGDALKEIYDPKTEIGKLDVLKAMMLEVVKKHANDLFHGYVWEDVQHFSELKIHLVPPRAVHCLRSHS